MHIIQGPDGQWSLISPKIQGLPSHSNDDAENEIDAKLDAAAAAGGYQPGHPNVYLSYHGRALQHESITS